MTPSPVRVRFAPSPTGYLHVGGARTVLYNWFFARQQGGQLLLRIEDTDVERNRPELTDNILEMIRWLDLDWDGEPIYQSKRADLYADAAGKLIADGRAYYCECTPDAIQARAKERGGPPGYDGFCRDRGLTPGPGRALRFRTPDDGTTGFDDVIRGEIAVPNSTLEDFVVLRSNGTPTFLLANAVDDADMRVTHVLRGEEHVNGTPKYLALGDALGLWGAGGNDRPVFAHLPILVNEARKKLSKRRDDVSVGDYRDRGYLPEAMVNYLALLGWGPPDGVEVRPRSELVELFRLEDVNPSPAFFDIRKLTAINGEYVRALPDGEFLRRIEPFLTSGERSRPVLELMAPLVKERVATLADAEPMVDFLWRDEPTIDEASWGRAMKGPAADILDDTIATFSPAEVEWTAEELHRLLTEVGRRHELKLAKAQAPVRVAVSGRTVGPPLFESLVVLGRDETLARLEVARARLE